MKRLVREYHRRDLLPDDIADWVIRQAVALQQIPAPTFHEADRAQHVAALFAELGLADIRTDERQNVYGYLPGERSDCPATLLMAHTDTVFPAGTDLTIRRQGNLIYGPGLGDNSIGVIGMLGIAYALQQRELRPASDLWFVATSREEGLGNLEGARLAYQTLAPKIKQVINIEGLAYGYVYHAGIAVRRLHITATAEGGHSWLHFGRASAIHQLMRLGATIADFAVPDEPRTTFNIGLLEGGRSINSIATEASLWLDLRSAESDALAALEGRVMAAVEQYRTDDVALNVEVVGDRPAGHIPADHPLIQGALAALSANGVRGTLQIGSTDGNIPLADGCPTVTVGVTQGGNAHRLDEYIETKPVASGMRQLLALTLAAAHHQDTDD